MRKKIDNKIKITYLVDFFRTINAGTERQLGYLLTHLPELNYSVQLISLQDSLFLKDEAPRLFPKVAIKTLGGQSDLSKSLSAFTRLYLLLRNSKPGIVHTFFPASNSFGVLISRLAGIRNIVSSRRDMGFNLTKKDIVLLRLANHFVSCVVSNSRAVQEHTLKVEGIKENKIHVIYNGISFDGHIQTSNKNGLKEAIVGIVANINRPIKRVDLFIKAASIVKKNFSHVKFWIIGEGYQRNELERLASDLGLNKSAIFLGRRKDVQKLLQKLSVGVICSDSEGFSNSIMEYMAAGLPVVATNVGGNPELVQDGKTGLLIPANNEVALAEAITNLLTDSKTANRMGNAGREIIISKFPVDGMLQKTRQLYESFLI